MARSDLNESIKKDLLDKYMTIRHQGGWLADFWDQGYALEEIAYLEELDDDLGSYQPQNGAERWAQDLMAHGGSEMFAAETDEERLALINRQIFNQWKMVSLAVEWDAPSWVIKSLTDVAKEKEKIRRKFRARQVHTSQPWEQVTEWEIEKARNYPLDQILGVGRIPCPFHGGEGKNFLVEKGFGYCFVCNEWADSIKWLMTQENYSFKEAVKKLQ